MKKRAVPNDVKVITNHLWVIGMGILLSLAGIMFMVLVLFSHMVGQAVTIGMLLTASVFFVLGIAILGTSQALSKLWLKIR
jgi:H+/Cl- antiporter ClcA